MRMRENEWKNVKEKKINTKHSIDFWVRYILRRSFQLKRIYWKIVHRVCVCVACFFHRLYRTNGHTHHLFNGLCVSLRTAMYFQSTVNHEFFFLLLSLFLYIAVVYIISLYQFVIDEMKSHHIFFARSFWWKLQNVTTDAQYQLSMVVRAPNCIYAILINFSKV